jgi:hypothetical protein
MKKILIFLSFFLFTLISCKKDEVCLKNNTICEEIPAIDELCAAFFERWFYDSSSSNCEKIGYSGCEQYGFETKQECEECDCSN